MKVVFFGTPDYVLPILNSVHKTFKGKGKSPIVAVVTQKPKPAGRKKQLVYSAVDNWAHKKKVRVHHDFTNLPKADLGILASYGEIIPKKVISHFPYGILNIHPSLLPKYRGASPVQATIVSGETETGVTIIKVDEKLDHGPIISQFREKVLSDDTTESLRNRLFEKSAEVLTSLISVYIQGKITSRTQNESEATFTRQLTKKDAFIPPKFLEAALLGKSLKKKWRIEFLKTKSSQASLIKNFTTHYSPARNRYAQALAGGPLTIHQFIRAMQPWPVAWTYVKLEQRTKNKEQRRLKILKAHVEKLMPNSYCLVPDLVQLEGKNPVTWKQFKEGYPEVKFTKSS